VHIRGPHRASPRQREVLALVTRGLTKAQIGRELFVSEETVKSHLHKLAVTYGTVGAREAGTHALVREALKRGDLVFDCEQRELTAA
jgi:DNA-binding NarL/FixJ family response regulator